MPRYRYDGSFEGLLTAIQEILARGERGAEILGAEDGNLPLFPPELVATRQQAARSLLEAFSAYGGKKGLRLVVLLFLADGAPRERLILDYVRLTLQQEREIGGWLTHPVVAEAVAVAGRVAGEVHRFKGLLRFRQLADGSLYAPFEPDHNIAAALAPHFARRLRGERWLIHDCRRGLGIFWDGRELVPAAVAGGIADPELSEGEDFFQACWRSYHHHISVAERRNPNLQRHFMPKRYWRYLTEFNGV
ncbi:MAG: TIGR03915 family putative DNA repair protein [Deltaproteobacteria bacterium]|nr:TIGR03915 family putative DNA repair protein [Deltaproteobacteria bacterium]